MGYTHYWEHEELSADVFAEFSKKAKQLALASNIPLADYMGEKGTRPMFRAEHIVLNGVGENSHESFVLGREGTLFTFCKTARKPYDTLVTAILCLAEGLFPNGTWDISSDGGAEEWKEGLELAKTIDPGATIPYQVRHQ
jgi:hypothetical protein